MILSFHIPCKGGDLNVSHRSFNIGNYVCDNRTEGEILIWRSCLINQDEFSLFLFVFLLSSMLKRMTKGLYETMIKAKIYMWHVNFTERRAWFVNVWTSLRCDLPPKVNVTHNCLLSTRENLMISLKTFMQEERFEVPLSFTWRVNFSNNRTWNEISIRPSLPPPTFLPS